jgi:hypothetical protein
MTTVTYKVEFGRQIKSLRQVRGRKVERVERPEPPRRRKADPRSSAPQLLALAHFIERGLIGGSIADFDHAVALVGVSRSRLSQIMKLLDLEPAVQEAVLLGGEVMGEHGLRREAGHLSWTRDPAWSVLGIHGCAPRPRPRRSATASRAGSLT